MVLPETSEEVSEILKFANKRKVPVTPKGAVGANVAYGCLWKRTECCGFIPGQCGDIQMMERQAKLNVQALKRA